MNPRSGTAVAVAALLFASIGALGCAADASGTGDGDEGATAASTDALRVRSSHCLYEPPDGMFRADARWSPRTRHLRLSIYAAAISFVTPGPHTGFHADLYDKHGGWVDTYDSPHDMRLASSRVFTLKRTMVPRAGDKLHIRVDWAGNGHCSMTLRA